MSEPVRVLQVIGILNQGGAETMIMNLYRHIDRNRVQFDFVENENDGAFFDNEVRNLGGRIYHCPRFNGKNYLSYIKWWKEFFDAHKEFKIVHGHIGSTAAFYLKEARDRGLVTIAHSHSVGTRNWNQLVYNVLSYPTRFISKFFFMCSKQAGISRYGKRVAEDKSRAFMIPNAIDANLYRFSEETRRRKRNELKIFPGTYLIGHVGRFVDAKNHLFLLKIFKKIVTFQPNSKLLLVGDGQLRPQIETAIADLGLINEVILLGMRSDVNELMMAMDVLVFPSIYEGLPVTLVEAQCSGLPCVISNKVSSDSVLIENLVQVKSLDNSDEEWAKASLDAECVDRIDCADRIKEAGFDVVENAKWLEEFYLEKAK